MPLRTDMGRTIEETMPCNTVGLQAMYLIGLLYHFHSTTHKAILKHYVTLADILVILC